MKNNNMSIKEILIIIFISVVSFGFFNSYVQSRNLPITVMVNAKVDQDDTFQLFYTTGNGSSSFSETDSIKKDVKKQDGFQTIKFDLPDKKIKSLRLDPGTKPGQVIVQDIRLKNIVHTYVFTPKSIINKFKPDSDIKKLEVKDGLVYMDSSGNDPQMINTDISYALQLLNSKKVVMAKEALAVILCLIFSVIAAKVLKIIYRLVVNHRKVFKKSNEILHNFLKYKNLLKELVIRDIKVKYKRSYLGIVWSVLNPLLMMVVIYIVFSNLFRFDIANFPMYLLTGQIMFNFFSESTNMAMTSVIGSGSLIKKVYIPKYIFPAARVLSSFVNLLFSLAAIVIMFIITKVKITWMVLMFPVPLFYLLIFSLGVGLILAAYTVFFRDIIHLYGVFLTAWMYVTPIFYPTNIIPPKYQIFIKLNPLYYMIEYFRDVILYGKLPTLRLNLICIFVSLSFLAVGLYGFYRNQNKFILYI